MPQAGIALAIGEFLGFAGATATIVGSIALIGTSYVVSRTINGNAQRNQPGDQGGRVQLPPATSNYVPVVYGSAYTNGIITDANIGNENKTMTYCLVLSEKTQSGSFTCARTAGHGGELSGIYWNDEQLVFDATDKSKVIKTVKSVDAENDTVSDNLNGLVRVWLYDGSSSTPFSGWNNSPAYDKMIGWDSTYKMSGLVFAIVEINYKQDKGVTGLPTLTFDINNSLSRPGDVFVDYATSVRYGAGIPSDEIDTATTSALNTWADTVPANQLNKAGGADTTTPRYRINGILDTSVNVKDNMDRILQNSAAWLSYNVVAGQWRIVMKKAVDTTSALVFDDSNILSGVNLSATNLTDLYNDLEIEYVDRYNKDQRGYSHPDMTGIQALMNPNEPANKLSMILDLTNRSVQADRIGLIELKQTRQDLVITFTASHYGIQAQAGDVIKVSNPIYGWTNHLFRINRVKEVESAEGALAVEITALEYNPDVYTDEAFRDFGLIKRIGIDPVNARTNSSKPVVSFPNDLINAVAAIPNFSLRTTMPAVGGPWDEIKLFYVQAGSNTTPAAETYAYFASLQPNSGTTGFLPNEIKDQQYAGIAANKSNESYFVKAQLGFRGVYGPLSDPVSITWDPVVSTVQEVAAAVVFTPNPVLVPATTSGTVTQAGQEINLMIQIGNKLVQLSTAVSDGAQANDTWRISAWSAGGGLTVSGPSYNTTTDKITWTITGLTTDSSTLSATIAYKDSSGVVSDLGARSVGITKVKNGVDGVSSPLLYLTSDAEVIKVSKTGAITPATITLTAVQGGGITGTPTFTIVSGAITGGLTGTGLTRTYSTTNQTTDSVAIRATNGAYSDSVTLVKLYEPVDGAGGLTGILTNEYAGIPATYEGSVTSYTLATTDLRIYEGIVETSQTGWNYSVGTISPTGSITGAFGSSSQTNRNKFTVTAMDGAVDVANVLLRATSKTNTALVVDKVFTIAKQKQGTPGASAKTVTLTAPVMSFTYSATGTTPSPAGPVVVTATAKNVVNPYYAFYEDYSSNNLTPSQNDYRSTYSYTPEVNYSQMPDTIRVEVREGSADLTGAIVAFDTMPLVAIKAGDPGRQTASVDLYLWSTVDPTTSAPPVGSTTYTWATAKQSLNSMTNGWSIAVPSNPGTSGIKLWVAKQSITDIATATATGVTWDGNDAVDSRNFTIYSDTMNGTNGASGTKNAFAEVYQWAASLPSSPTGTGTYTWSTSSYSAPTSWSLTITTSPSAGYTLWKASVPVQDTATATTTSFNWTNSKLIATGYAGQTGATGAAGAAGAAGVAGLSSRICYSQTTLSALGSSPSTITTSGNATFPPSGTWGAGTSWSGSPGVLSVGESLYQSDGIYNPVTNATVWNVPYLSSLKVGSLSAITANMGTLTAGDITIGSAPTITSVSTMTGSGTHLYDNGGFAMGTATTNIVYRGQSGDKIYLNGDIVATGNLQANSVTQIQSGQYTSPYTFNYSTGGDAAAVKFRLPLQTYISGTILNVFFTATKVDPGAGDIEVVFNILNASNVLVDTFGGAPIGQRMVQTMGPRYDKVTATFTGSVQLVTGGQYKIEALVYNSYGDSWTSNRVEVIVLGAKR
jgi:hypothetical protein